MTVIAVYGAGGFGREVAWLVESCNAGGGAFSVACFVDDEEARHGEVLNGIPVMGLREARSRFPDAKLVAAAGHPAVREKLVENAERAGWEFQTLVHPRVEMSRWVTLGAGTVICAGNILTTNIELGRHVQINLDCTIGHDVVMGDFATLAPGVHVSGCVHIGRGAYVGTGATIINGTRDAPLVIGDGAVVGAGACVIRPVPPGTTVVGVPARPR
jgi:sugar O-acyltransferase (sialic acid O-acetyltransferase NeuD family)